MRFAFTMIPIGVRVGIHRPLIVFPDVGSPRHHVGLRRNIGAKAKELVPLDFGVHHDVDDAIGGGGITRRWVSDDFYAVDGVGGQGLDVGLEVFFREVGRLVIDPNFNGRSPAQGDVAFHNRRPRRLARSGRLRLDTMFSHLRQNTAAAPP